MPAPKSKKGKGKGKYVASTPAQAAVVATQPAALPELPADAINTPAPDPEPGDDASNKPGSAPLQVAVNAPGGVPGITLPKWAVVAGGTAVVASLVVAGVALARSSR
jgi:hypothetical protein